MKVGYCRGFWSQTSSRCCCPASCSSVCAWLRSFSSAEMANCHAEHSHTNWPSEAQVWRRWPVQGRRPGTTSRIRRECRTNQASGEGQLPRNLSSQALAATSWQSGRQGYTHRIKMTMMMMEEEKRKGQEEEKPDISNRVANIALVLQKVE